MRVPYTVTPTGVSMFVEGKMLVVSATAANFAKLVDALKQPGDHDTQVLQGLADVRAFVAKKTFGKVQISGDEVRWNGTKIANALTDKLLQMLEAGDDLSPLGMFLDRVMLNPAPHAREELYLWLESGHAPITPDGYFLAFKRVRPDYRDIYTGTVDNSVGQTPAMPRSSVDDDRNRTCSRGLHFCSFGYLPSFSGHGDQDHVMVLKIDPADVVAIPADYRNQKGRTWTYEVVGEVPLEAASTFFHRANVVETYQDAETLRRNAEAAKAAKLLGYAAHPVDDDGEEFDEYEGDNDDDDLFDVRADEEAEEELEEAVPPTHQAPGKPTILFHGSNGRSYLASDVMSAVAEHGQRGWSRMTGIPRTTLQEWLSAIRKQGE